MKKTIHAVLAITVMAIGIAATFGSTAGARYLYPPCSNCNDSSGS